MAMAAFSRAQDLASQTHNAFGGSGESAATIALQVLVVLIPCAGVFSAVSTQSKTIAAFAQLGDLQERQDRRSDIAQRAVQVDKNWFCLGVMNGWLTAYITGAWPTGYYLFYTPKVLLLTLLRFVTFRKKKQHFLLWDFCYWANFLCVFYCWWMPHSPRLFRVVFMCANGPLAWSVLAFNHAMIFHSSAHITSVVIHTSPLILTYALRWYSVPVDGEWQDFRICDGDSLRSCESVGAFKLVSDALLGFYLWWMVLYYVWIFVALGGYIERNGYQTLWDRILQMKPIGPLLHRLLNKFPKLAVQLVYLIIHLAFSTATMFVACILFWSHAAQICFLFAILYSTVKNAASFYFDIFEQHYASIVKDGGRESLSKKVVAASPALAELKQPLAAEAEGRLGWLFWSILAGLPRLNGLDRMCQDPR
eukprot:CAMPEP_0197893336 /NCGR_PEP_ID=MMETSP1439-20131203/32698_1 /TAXON_ID=66791 /ORGANISM="Gonyaulax spinifera, Strain CCMP409" /LENGTH=420 /DNA_ID=CAMNT_0043513599 /DNA_START=69 /DNA_END=1328 /DNA_ORIENTATION=-